MDTGYKVYVESLAYLKFFGREKIVMIKEMDGIDGKCVTWKEHDE